MSAAREVYRCASCFAWQPMERRDRGGWCVRLLGAAELEQTYRPRTYLLVPTCIGEAKHELCDACRALGCLACFRARGREAFEHEASAEAGAA